jgi:hypothetical protein
MSDGEKFLFSWIEEELYYDVSNSRVLAEILVKALRDNGYEIVSCIHKAFDFYEEQP